MARVHISKDDTVVVLSGAAKGKSGRVLSVDRNKERILVEGVNVHKKTVRRSQEHPQGGIIEVERTIHASNVMLEEKYQARRDARGVVDEEPKPEEPEPETPEVQDDEVEEPEPQEQEPETPEVQDDEVEDDEQ